MINEAERIEKDFLGEKAIPADAYYGIQTLRAVENFSVSGCKIHPELIKAVAIIKKAAAQANMSIGCLNETIGKHIAETAAEIIDGQYHGQFIVDPIQGGAGTSVNMNANEVIANVALEKMGHKKGSYHIINPNTHVNVCQSTNDVIPTAVKICILYMIDKLLLSIDDLKNSFIEKAAAYSHVMKMGRTHLQDAVPISFGQELDAYAKVLARDIKRIESCKYSLCEVNIGGTIIGTGVTAGPKYADAVLPILIEFCGFPLRRTDSLVDATQNTDCYTELSSALKICAINSSKIANDFRLMVSGPQCGLSEITLPARQPGSSMMPGKVNPVMPELINQVAFQVIGNDHTISLASEAGQFELNVMTPVIIFNLLQSTELMTNAFRSFNELCVKGLTVNETKMREYAGTVSGMITSTDSYVD
jgi:aspartate ammonia-lyase